MVIDAMMLSVVPSEDCPAAGVGAFCPFDVGFISSSLITRSSMSCIKINPKGKTVVSLFRDPGMNLTVSGIAEEAEHGINFWRKGR